MAARWTCVSDARSSPRLLGLLLMWSVVSMLGCGSSGPTLIPVKGRVTLDGKPVADAAVGLIPIEGGPMASGVTNADGVFDLSTGNKSGAVPGKQAVTVTKVEEIGYNKDGSVGPRGLRSVWHVPQKYSRRETSGLTAVVSTDGKDLSLELSSR
jgi:hypothetical protein